MGIANSRPLVTFGAEQRKPQQPVRFVIPAAVSRANDFAIITPCIWEWYFLAWFVAIEAKARDLACKM